MLFFTVRFVIAYATHYRVVVVVVSADAAIKLLTRPQETCARFALSPRMPRRPAEAFRAKNGNKKKKD